MKKLLKSFLSIFFSLLWREKKIFRLPCWYNRRCMIKKIIAEMTLACNGRDVLKKFPREKILSPPTLPKDLTSKFDKRFSSSQFHILFTLISKFFSSFPVGTCSLSVSRLYLTLDEIYHPQLHEQILQSAHSVITLDCTLEQADSTQRLIIR